MPRSIVSSDKRSVMSRVEDVIRKHPGINLSGLEALCVSIIPPEVAIRRYNALVANNSIRAIEHEPARYEAGARNALSCVAAALHYNGRIIISGKRGHHGRTYTINASYKRKGS